MTKIYATIRYKVHSCLKTMVKVEPLNKQITAGGTGEQDNSNESDEFVYSEEQRKQVLDSIDMEIIR